MFIFPNKFTPAYYTIGQLQEICRDYRYLLIVDSDGNNSAINCRAMATASVKFRQKSQRTSIIAVKPCGINEYITHKIPFIIL